MRLRAVIIVIAYQSNVGGIKDIDWDGGTRVVRRVFDLLQTLKNWWNKGDF